MDEYDELDLPFGSDDFDVFDSVGSRAFSQAVSAGSKRVSKRARAVQQQMQTRGFVAKRDKLAFRASPKKFFVAALRLV